MQEPYQTSYGIHFRAYIDAIIRTDARGGATLLIANLFPPVYRAVGIDGYQTAVSFDVNRAIR